MTDKNRVTSVYQNYLNEKHARFAIDEKLIEDEVSKATGAEVKTKKRVIAGEDNEVYDVTTSKGNFILRISRETEDTFTPEMWALNEARAKGAPTPQVLLIEDIKDKERDVRVAVETKLPGRALNEIHISHSHARAIVSQAGEILAKIHSVVPKKFGYLGREGVGKYETWELFMLKVLTSKKVKGVLDAANKAKVPKDQINEALRIIKENSIIFQGITPHLIHGDFGPKHILVEGNMITGIIDFENARSGDIVWDFAWWSYFGKNRPPIEWLMEGYEKLSKLPGDFDLRLRLYRLRMGLDLICYYVGEKHELGLQVTRVNLIEDLEFFGKLRT